MTILEKPVQSVQNNANLNDISPKSNRIDYIDLFRALGIMLMIMGQIGFGKHFDKFIHGFHMPMFFIISGFFFKKENIKIFLIKKLKTLIIPYFAFGIFHIFLYSIIYQDFKIEFIKNLFWEITLCIPISGALWFLPAMFFAGIFYTLIQSTTMKKGIKTLFVILVFQ